jgi:hypothetical protein
MATMLSGGCGYTVQLRATIDGRARVVWNSSDSEATATLAGGGLSQECEVAIRQLTGQERMPLDRQLRSVARAELQPR